MRSGSRRWIDAARRLGRDASANVPCPECDAGPLSISDRVAPGSPRRLQRSMRCSLCDAHNVILIPTKD